MDGRVKYNYNYDQIVALIAKKERSLASIERELGMSRGYLLYYCKKHKINHGRTVGAHSRFNYDQVVALVVKKGRTLVSIEKEIGMHRTYLARYCERHKINHGRSKIGNRIYDYSQVLTLTKEGMALTAIVEKLKIPYQHLFAYCKRHGISYIAKGRRGHNYDHNQISALIAEEGRTLTSIAEEIGVKFNTFSRYCARHKIDHGRTRKKYDYDIVKISKLAKKGILITSIAKKLKIPYALLYQYCKNHKIPFQGKTK